jgi:aminomethyltransferase
MLNGLLSNRPPPPISGDSGETRRGLVVYSTLLTSKGRMITDLRIFRDPLEGFILDLPRVGTEGGLAHLRKFLPPRLARVEDRSGEFALLTLLGPGAPPLLTKSLAEMGISFSAAEMSALQEGEELFLPTPEEEGIRVVGNGETSGKGWDLLTSPTAAKEIRTLLEEGGAVPLTECALETLRIEKGRPAFGKDMDEHTIPVEAGIHGRAIDNEKGCYTGQEVIIRIRDRGHVNKELRGFLFGNSPVPASGQEFFQPGRQKGVGWVTSAVVSPAFGQTVALGYLQRRVGPGEEVRVGGSDGPVAQIRALSDEGWILD